MFWLYLILVYILSVFIDIAIGYSLWIRQRPKESTLGQFKTYLNDDDTFWVPLPIMFIPGLNTLILVLLPIGALCYLINNSDFNNIKIR